MMTRLVSKVSWPLLAIAIALAVLSLPAPSWMQARIESSASASRVVETSIDRAAAPRADRTAARIERPEHKYEPLEAPTQVLRPAVVPMPVQPMRAPATEAAPAEAVPAAEQPAEPAAPPRKTLADVEAPAQEAPTGPLVAEQIDLDPSLIETPALPPARASINDDDAVGSSLQPSLLPASSALEGEAAPLEPAAETLSTGPWALAKSLVEQLQTVAASQPTASDWALGAVAKLEALAKLPTLDDPQAAEILNGLAADAEQGKELARNYPENEDRTRLLRAGYAIVRRHAIWSVVHQLAVTPPEIPEVGDFAVWNRNLTEVNRLFPAQGAASWRKYLLIDEALQKIGATDVSVDEQRKLVLLMLDRIHSTQLAEDQSYYLENQPAVQQLVTQMKLLADEPADLAGLVLAIEKFEHDGLASESAALADAYQDIRFSNDERVRQLAETVNAFYRNANVRVALSATLINRLLPQEQQMQEPVYDQIQGAYVQGASNTSTRLRLVLLPDRLRWRMGLEARGEVASSTASSKGPATFYQDGLSTYRARKMLTVDRKGIRIFSAEAQADANNSLTDFETNFDGIPLVSNLVRSIARSQYDAAAPLAKMEVEHKIVGRATSKLDEEVAAKLEKAKLDFQTKLLSPLQKLELDPTAVDMETTEERLIARYRLAGRHQVSAHTPRPQAPGDSLLSVQVHDSALNNVLEQLKLHGRKVDLIDLFKEVTARFNQEVVPVPEDLPEDVMVTFADTDPVQVDCIDGRLRLTIRLKELSHGKSKWTNFTVRGYYVPTSDQLDANLARDGVIELIGGKLRFGDQVALRGIFSRVLSRNRKLSLVNKQLAESPELRDLQVTQFVLHDGWIGVALGPKLPERQAIAPVSPAR